MGKKNFGAKKTSTLPILLAIFSCLVTFTLAYFFTSDWASSHLQMSGKVEILAVGKGDTYNSIEDTKDSCNLEIKLSDNYEVLIPNMQIECPANVKVKMSSTTPLLRAKFTLELYDINGDVYDPIADISNITGNLQYQLNSVIEQTGGWYQYIDNYYYYIGTNSVNETAGNTILKEVDATSSDTVVEFINSPINFPSFVTSDYSGFGVKIKVTFQAIQNFIPNDEGIRVSNTITNSLKIFRSIFDSKYAPAPLEYFEISTINGKNTLSLKDNVTLPETLVLPTVDASGNIITAIDDSLKGNQTVKEVIFPSTYTIIAPNAFQGSSITSVDLSNTSIETVSSNAFSNCKKLTSVSLPNTVETIGVWAFGNCSLTSLVLPESLVQLNIGSLYLNKLTSLYIPASVKIIDEAAINCSSLKTIKVDNDNPYYKDDLNIAIYTKDNKNLIFMAPCSTSSDYYGANIEQYHILSGCEKIYNLAFQWCGIKNLYIPSSLKYVDKQTFYSNARFGKFYVDSANTSFKATHDNTQLVSYDGKTLYRFAILSGASEIIIDSSITTFHPASLSYLHTNCNLVFNSTTPSSTFIKGLSDDSYGIDNIVKLITIYVPDSAVNAYKTAYSDIASIIYPVSQKN